MSRFFAVVLLLSSYLAYVATGTPGDVQCSLLIHVNNIPEDRLRDSCTHSNYSNVAPSPIPMLSSGEGSADQTTSNVVCPNISSAFDYISANVSSVNCVHVSLSTGDHVFTQPHNISVGIILTGSNGSTVWCDYETSQKPVRNATYLKYTLFFLQVHLVRFEQIRFEGCKQPFRLEKVENVAIIDSYFTHFTDSVFDIYNCLHIIIDNSTFINNTGHGTVLLPLRGNTGAVSIGYHENSNFHNESKPTLSITDSRFIANDAGVKRDTFSTSTTAFLHNRFTGRGGSLAILMGLTIGDLTANISQCLFQQNHAVSFGGALYLLFTGQELHHYVKIEDSNFIDNIADNGAGAIQVTFNRAEVLVGQPMTVLMRNCNFIGNRAFIGGAVFLFPSAEGEQGNLQILENCYFYKNQADETGAALSASQFAFFVPKDNLVNHRITNCTFVENYSPNGIVAVHYVTLEFNGMNNFSGNAGPAMRVIGTLVDINNTIVFERNAVRDVGGALFIESSGQIRVFPHTVLLFDSNSGRVGSAINVQSQTTSVVYNRLIHNVQCFLLYANKEIPLVNLTRDMLNVTFYHNKALFGSSMFLSTTELCTWIGNEPPYFETISVLKWKFAEHIGEQDNDVGIRTAPTKMILPNNVTGWPGQRISVNMEAVDELNFMTGGLVQVITQNSSDEEGNVVIAQNVQLITPDDDGLQLDYTIDRNSLITDDRVSISVHELFTSVNGSISLVIAPCIAGYRLVRIGTDYFCQCNLDIKHILQCENDQVTILISDGLWASSDLGDPDDNLKAYKCPPGYCSCSRRTSLGPDECHYIYNNSDPNLQCTCDREDILCGNCKDGKGVSILFSECVDCDNAFGALIGVLVIIDAVIITAILIKEISIPAWLLPAIFNIQMIAYVGEYYPITYEKTGKYIYYIGSAISLYFPYDFCLYSGTTALASYTFRYIPFWLSAVIFSVIFYYYYRKRQHRTKTYGLWTLMLLLYSHVVYTSMSLLNCPSIIDSNGVHKPRWHFNASVECFNEAGHILLGIWAIVVLMFCALFIPFVGAVSKRLLQRPYWVIHFRRVLYQPYKIRWWCVVELGRRLIFLLMITAFPGNPSPPTLILMITFMLYIYFMPYKETLVNVSELVFQLAFLLFLLLRSTSDIIDRYYKFSGQINSRICSENNDAVTDLTLLLLPFAWLPVIGTILLTLYYLLNSKLHVQHFRKLFGSKSSDHLQTWLDRPGDSPHYKTIYTEFVPNDSYGTWELVTVDKDSEEEGSSL